MSDSCAYRPMVKNKQGELVDSRLFDSLLSIFSKDRKSVKKHYYIATNEKFLSTYKEDVEFDENGEITIDSYKRITNLDINEEVLLNSLNKQYKTGILEKEEAIGLANRFNSNSDFKKSHIAVLSEADGGKIKVEIKKRTEQEEQNLKEFFKRKTLVDRIINRLRELGVDVKFLEDGSKTLTGRYSTVNAEKTQDGLYALISILSGDNVEEVLTHEAGHFIYGSMRGNPLVQRLFNNLTPEVIQELFSEDEYRGFNLESERLKTELAGELIGKALLKQNTGVLSNLISRIILAAKKLYSKLTKNEVKKIAIEAEIIANKLSSDFMSSNFVGTVNTALSVEETLLSNKYSRATKIYYNEVLTRLKNYQKEMSRIVSKNAKTYRDKFNSLTGTTRSNISEALESGSELHEKLWAVQGIIDTVDFLIAEFQKITEGLDGINFKDGVIDYNKMNTIREARQFINFAMDLVDVLGEAIALSDPFDKVAEGVKSKFNTSFNTLKTLLLQSNYDTESGKTFDCLHDRIKKLEVDAYSLFLEKSYGSKYIRRAKRAVFEKGPKWWRPVRVKVLTNEDGDDVWYETISEYLSAESDTLHKEDSALAWFFTSFPSVQDPTGQMFDDFVKFSHRYANKKALNYMNRLQELFADLNKIQGKNGISRTLGNPVDASAYYETYEDGKFTGNIMRLQNYGKYHKTLAKAFEEWEKEFNDKYSSRPELIDTEEKRLKRWKEFYTPKLNDWHDDNTVYITTKINGETKQVAVPAMGEVYEKNGIQKRKKDYTNIKYQNLSSEEKQFIENWVDLMQELNALINKSGLSGYRLPQFRGDTLDKFKTAVQHASGENAFDYILQVTKEGGKSLWDSMVESISITSEDSDYETDKLDYNDDSLYNPEHDEMFGEALKRLPLYGVHRLDNPDLLSRDLFYSTMMYAMMACKYEALNEASYAYYMGEQVYSRIHDRAKKGYSKGLKGKMEKLRDLPKRYFIGRFRRAAEKSIFSKYNIAKVGKFSINKIASTITRIGSSVTVGGNVSSGSKDMIGKIMGILREAHAQDYVSAKSVKKAFKWYLKHVGQHAINLGTPYSDDPITLFKNYFNVSDTWDELARDFRPQKHYLRRLLNSLMYAPLTASGDIETVIYLALAFETKVRDTSTGEVKSLMDIFEEDRNKLKKAKIKTVFNFYNRQREILASTSDESLSKYKTAMSFIQKVETFYSDPTNTQGTAILRFANSLSQEEQAYIQQYLDKGIHDYKKIAELVYLDVEINMLYNTKSEAVGIEGLGRFINSRVSGVYNNADRTAFQDEWEGAIVYAQKGWFTGAVAEAEYLTNRFNTKTKNENEGAKISLLKYLVDLFSFGGIIDNTETTKEVMARKGLMLLALVQSALWGEQGQKGQKRIRELGYSKNQAANIARNIDNVLSILTLKGLAAGFLALSKFLVAGSTDTPDEEDKERLITLARLSGVAHYIFKASELELASMFLPWYLLKQITSSSDVSKFVALIGITKLGQLTTQSIAAVRNNNRDEENSNIIFSIDPKKDPWRKEKNLTDDIISKEYAEQLGINTKGTVKDDEDNIRLVREYQTYPEDIKDAKGNIIYKKGDFITDSKGERKLLRIRPLYKGQYGDSKKYSTFFEDNPKYKYTAGENKWKRTGKKLIPYYKHYDVLNDPIQAAEDLEKWMWQN